MPLRTESQQRIELGDLLRRYSTMDKTLRDLRDLAHATVIIRGHQEGITAKSIEEAAEMLELSAQLTIAALSQLRGHLNRRRGVLDHDASIAKMHALGIAACDHLVDTPGCAECDRSREFQR